MDMKNMKRLNRHSVPQATPSGGPARDERSEQLVSGSKDYGFRIKSGMTECGRSMVEMLGVLAVMGVLSVGGVAMYTNAMNKYRANEILNEASKRAVMVAGQLLTNPSATTMSLSQFGSNAVAGATFKENAAISNGKITLTFETAPDESICNQMIAATGTNSAMQVASGCGTITFKADMSKGVTASSEDTACLTVECGTGASCSNGYCVCDNGQTYLGYLEEPCSATLNNSCSADSDCEDSYGCCASDGKCYRWDWDTEQCDEDGNNCTMDCATPTKRCTSYADCISLGTGYYCELGSADNCEQPTYGTCKEIGNSKTLTNSQKSTLKAAGFNDETIEMSADYMSWWSADDWCKAKGKSLIDISGTRLNCYKSSDGTTAISIGENTNVEYCCAKDNKSCSSTASKQSTQMQALRTAFPNTYGWTATSYDSCRAFYVNLDYGSVSTNHPRDDSSYALCE